MTSICSGIGSSVIGSVTCLGLTATASANDTGDGLLDDPAPSAAAAASAASAVAPTASSDSASLLTSLLALVSLPLQPI
jgi:hypothetical protein